MIINSDGYWIWIESEEQPNYEISGKYLFFSEDKDKLIKIAINEITNHHFHMAKVNENIQDGHSDHVLCIYYKDNSRKDELAKRNREQYKTDYKYWKSEEATQMGQYSERNLF